jgi:hypothetical protein
MIEALGGVLDTARDRVLVIDDGSPGRHRRDRLTGSRAALRGCPYCTARRRRGSGPPYIAGFRRALDEGAELVLEMDCDFSHDPRTCRADRGQRTTPTSCSARGTPRAAARRTGGLRGASSRAAAASTRRSSSACASATSPEGSSASAATALEAIDLDALSAHGYAFQIETTYRIARAGLRVQEVPITFVERRAGRPKMTGSIVAEAMWKVPLLRLRALTGKL